MGGGERLQTQNAHRELQNCSSDSLCLAWSPVIGAFNFTQFRTLLLN